MTDKDRAHDTWRRTLEVMTAERDAALADVKRYKQALRRAVMGAADECQKAFDAERELAQAVTMLRKMLAMFPGWNEPTMWLVAYDSRHPDTHDAEGDKGSSPPAPRVRCACGHAAGAHCGAGLDGRCDERPSPDRATWCKCQRFAVPPPAIAMPVPGPAVVVGPGQAQRWVDSWQCPGCHRYTGHDAGCPNDVEGPPTPGEKETTK